MYKLRPVEDPGAILRERLAARQVTVAALERRDARIALGRLFAFFAVAGAAVASFGLHRLPPWWLVPPGLAFLALVVLHDRALRRLALARHAVTFHLAALSRLEGRWAGTGDGGERYASEDHPYALDLDLFGKGSIFELVCTARTRAGADLLASWLLSPADASEVRARQAAVAELAPGLDLREGLAVLSEEVRAEVHPEGLGRWGETRRALPGWLVGPALLLGAVTLATLALWLEGRVHGLVFVAALVVDWLVTRALRDRVLAVLGGVERPGAELLVLARLLARLERETFVHERLRSLRGSLGQDRHAASHRIGALGHVVERAGWAENQAFAPLGFLVLWRLHAALAVERWRAAHGRSVRAWLAAAAELEALSSLAAHAFLHPEDPFPELDDGAAGAGGAGRASPSFEAEGLGHPLLPPDRLVRNDLRLAGDTRLVVVSGSNMSGKSTLLRTVGANAVLALAGCPVRARRLRLCRVQVGATLRIQDSLTEGRSRFYAEIKRLRAIMDLAAASPAGSGEGRPPVLFLLDELLAGTNSRDRRIGGEAVLRALLDRGAIGLVTTHDLALSEMASSLGEAANAHFEDEVHGGEVIFDYRLRPGVVTRSNALALMRAVGLEV